MRFGKWRGVSLAFTLAAVAALSLGSRSTARADGLGFHQTIPRVVDAYDFTTGGPYYAPPIPYGHYAKDPGAGLNKAIALGRGLFHGGHGDDCGGKDCGGGHGTGCGACGGGGSGCGFCLGRGLFSHGGAGGCGSGLLGHGRGLGLGHGHKNFAPCHPTVVTATSQAQPTAQAVVQPSGQSLCGQPGCGLMGKHSHLGNMMNKLRCRLCGGRGCGGCGGLGVGDPCGSCGGQGLGCGRCGGCGLSGLGLGSRLHGVLGSLTGRLHQPKVDWFVGPGGPVPLTPGYVPYVVPTRSPRDFFAFPPMNPNVP